MPKPRIKEIHINIDLGVNYAHITVYDNYYRIKKEESHKGSTYANNGIKQHCSMPSDFTNLKHSNIYNSIAVCKILFNIKYYFLHSVTKVTDMYITFNSFHKNQ